MESDYTSNNFFLNEVNGDRDSDRLFFDRGGDLSDFNSLGLISIIEGICFSKTNCLLHHVKLNSTRGGTKKG